MCEKHRFDRRARASETMLFCLQALWQYTRVHAQHVSGTGSGTRTRTALRPTDFKSVASTKFRHPGAAIPAVRPGA